MTPQDVAQLVHRLALSPVVNIQWADTKAGTGCNYQTADGRTFFLTLAQHDQREATVAICRTLLIGEVGAMMDLPEARSLIATLRDETQSWSILRRCKAWLGEAT